MFSHVPRIAVYFLAHTMAAELLCEEVKKLEPKQLLDLAKLCDHCERYADMAEVKINWGVV